MKPVTLIIYTTLTALVGLGVAQAQDAKLAAKVNGEGISFARLQSTVDASMRDGKLNYGGITQPTHFKQLQRIILDQLIAQELLWQEARREGVIATAQEVDAALAQVRQRYTTEQAYLEEIERNGFSQEAYRDDVKRHISVRRWAQTTLAKEITVPDSDVHDFYVTNQARFAQPEQINARHVLITLPAGADEAATAAARKRIEEVLAQAKAGTDFAELAKKYSQGPSADRGGDLGFAPRGAFVKPFEDAAFALKPGEISNIVRTEFGFHVIKLEARREGHVVPEQQAAPAIRRHLLSNKFKEAIEEHVRRLRAQGSVEILISL